jgi:Protein of unknown function (DUF1116)
VSRTEANREAIERVLACEPRLVGVRPAGEVVPGLERELILHAAPPISWDDASELLRGGLIGAAIFEGLAAGEDEAEAKLAAGEIRLGAAQDYGAMAGGVGSIVASLPVMVLEDPASGSRGYHFLMEGFGKTLVLGMWGDEVGERLAWFRDELGPALDAALREVGGLDLAPLMAEALRRGDELHNRNAAATSMLAERLAPGFARAGVAAELQERAFALMAANPQFFVPCSLAAARLALRLAEGIEGSSLVTACGANGTECGIKVAGIPDRWFTAPAEVPEGVVLEGFTADDAGPGCGDSLLVECYGLGASVLPAAPALWPQLGVDEARARSIYEDTGRIALAEDARFPVPLLGGRGAPVGIDAAAVVETGIRPVIDIVMVHPERGKGMIGFGLTSPPLACFEQAVEVLDDL